MIHVIATVKLKPGKRAEFLRYFHSNIANVLAERGCIEYTPAVDAATNIPIQNCDENSVVIIEKWESQAALEAHLAAPHMASYRKQVHGLVENVNLRILQEA